MAQRHLAAHALIYAAALQAVSAKEVELERFLFHNISSFCILRDRHSSQVDKNQVPVSVLVARQEEKHMISLREVTEAVSTQGLSIGHACSTSENMCSQLALKVLGVSNNEYSDTPSEIGWLRRGYEMFMEGLRAGSEEGLTTKTLIEMQKTFK